VRDGIAESVDGLPAAAAARFLLTLAGRGGLAAGVPEGRIADELADLADRLPGMPAAEVLMRLLDRLRGD
jgi:hypothetical protein